MLYTMKMMMTMLTSSSMMGSQPSPNWWRPPPPFLSAPLRMLLVLPFSTGLVLMRTSAVQRPLPMLVSRRLLLLLLLLLPPFFSSLFPLFPLPVCQTFLSSSYSSPTSFLLSSFLSPSSPLSASSFYSTPLLSPSPPLLARPPLANYPLNAASSHSFSPPTDILLSLKYSTPYDPFQPEFPSPLL